jgi:helicase SWR1
MDMNIDVPSALRDNDPVLPSDAAAPTPVDEPLAEPSDATTQDTSAAAVAAEEQTSAENGDDSGIAQRPSKRRRLDDLTPSRSTSRAASPPWKSFAADGPTTIIANGIRKSTRVGKDAPTPPLPPPGPAKRGTRNPKATPTKHPAKSAPKAPAPPARKSDRQRKPSATALESPQAQRIGSPESSRKRAGRPRKSTTASRDDAVEELLSTPAWKPPYSNDFHVSPSDPFGPTPRLRLRLRKPEPPNRHPHHAPPAHKFPSFADWLRADDPLEGEEGQRMTQEKADEEADRRMRIVHAAENGVLSQARSSVFIPDPAEDPPPHYGQWDHVVAHALHFNKLLKEENTYHRRVAKTLAREAIDHWKEKYKRKTQEEIDQEETDRALLRYKQLVKDVKDSWAVVKLEIDKERVAKWEEEQLQLGHKAMDDMFNQAQEILGRGVVDSASSIVSEDRDSEEEGEGEDEDEEDEEDFEKGGSVADEAEEDDENLSSDADSEDGGGHDEDADLTAEQLQTKYNQIPDVLQESSGEEEQDDGEADDGDERTPEPTPDPDIEMEAIDSPTGSSHERTNGRHETEEVKNGIEIDFEKIELEEVDEALLDSDDGDTKSRSGSEEWPSDEGSEEGEEEEQSESESDDGDGHLGMMGFLAPSEIKILKEAAKDRIHQEEHSSETHKIHGINGHDHPKPEETPEDTKVDGNIKQAEEAQAVEDSAPIQSKLTVQVPEAESVDEMVEENTVSRSRSRQTTSPPRAEIPPLLRGTLREYQHDGLDWLANLYDSDTNGILADEMGLGKTIQTISVLAWIAVQRGAWGPHLVVVPTSVMLNWEMEFKKFLPGFKILTYYGDINERKKKRMGWRTTGRDMYNVVITSYQLILQDAAAFKMRAWQYLVLDEAHNIKNFKSQRWQTMLNLRTEKRLLLTGTPLQNNIDELWSLLYFLMPAGFAGEGRIAGLEEFTMALKNPTSQILDQGRQQLDAEAQKIVRKLHEVLRPYLLRRLKADVEKQMPGKYEHVVYCKLSKRQRHLYDGFMGRASTKAILSSGNYMSIINCLMSLRKVCNHPDLFETRAIVTSMAMPRSVAAAYEIKDLFIRRQLQRKEEEEVSLDALNLLFVRREQLSKLHARRTQQIRAIHPLGDLIERQTRRLNSMPTPVPGSVEAVLSSVASRENAAIRDHFQSCLRLTRARTEFLPLYGKSLLDRLTMDYQDYAFGAQDDAPLDGRIGKKGRLGFRAPRNPTLTGEWGQRQISFFYDMVPTIEQRAEAQEPIIAQFSCVTPAVAADDVAALTVSRPGVDLIRSSPMAHTRDPFHESRIRLSIAFPDKRLLQYDCGKLQRLATLLRDLQAGGHRALIFTQMTKVLDILEQFLNIHGHRYLRLDGATKVEQRQILTDRFNNDPRILCFILSSRSGGLGINLTGADTVIFYDLDWNPAMDKQCQDRSHRIGQTRDVHIYKFVSEYTIEANILRKSNQKRLLDDVIIQKGDFTTDYFNKVNWRDAMEEKEPVDEAGAAMDRVLGEKAGLLGDAKVMHSVEDTEDQNAAHVAQKEIVDEINDDQVDFSESVAMPTNANADAATRRAEQEAVDRLRKNPDADKRHVDEYMLDWFREEFGKEPFRPPTDRQKRSRKGHDVHRTHRKKKY